MFVIADKAPWRSCAKHFPADFICVYVGVSRIEKSGHHSISWRHLKKTNMKFMDGYVESLSADQTLLPSAVVLRRWNRDNQHFQKRFRENPYCNFNSVFLDVDWSP